MTEANSAQPLERRVIVKLSWRILPLIFLMRRSGPRPIALAAAMAR